MKKFLLVPLFAMFAASAIAGQPRPQPTPGAGTRPCTSFDCGSHPRPAKPPRDDRQQCFIPEGCLKPPRK